jgi:hypothetical protein
MILRKPTGEAKATVPLPLVMNVLIPLRTRGGMNSREHPMVRHRRVAAEKETVRWHLKAAERAGLKRPDTPCTFVLTRIAPSGGLDPFDNLPSSLKSVVDALAAWMGVDDRKSEVVRYTSSQERGPWGVRIEVRP